MVNIAQKREKKLAFGSQYLQNTYGGGYFVNKAVDRPYDLYYYISILLSIEIC